MSPVIIVRPWVGDRCDGTRVPRSGLCPGHGPWRDLGYGSDVSCITFDAQDGRHDHGRRDRSRSDGRPVRGQVPRSRPRGDRVEPDAREGRGARLARGVGSGHPRRGRPERRSGRHGRVGPRGAAGRHRRPGRHRRRRERVDHGDRDVDGRTPGGALAGDRAPAGGGPAGCSGPRQPVRGRGGHAPRVRRRPAPSRRPVDPALRDARLGDRRRSPRVRSGGEAGGERHPGRHADAAWARRSPSRTDSASDGGSRWTSWR